MSDVHSDAKGVSIPTERVCGPVEVLCREIDFAFDARMERDDLLIAFVSELVGEVGHLRGVQAAIADLTGEPPSEESSPLLDLALSMVALDLGLSRAARERIATSIHDRSHEVNPDDPGHSCDHLVDMLSSCASAIRFGLEKPCRSRHAAEAASHVWKHKYGVSLFDGNTPRWQREWARAKLQSALLSLLSPTTASSVGADGEAGSEQKETNPND